jgi:hypothetical protein
MKKQLWTGPNDRGFAYNVIQRDEKCVNCGSIKNLQAHHIIPVSEGGSDDLENGKALCEECHANEHADIPRGIFFTEADESGQSGGWNATSLAALLGCHPRTVTLAAKRLGIEKTGHGWAFSDEEVDTIKQDVTPRAPASPVAYDDMPPPDSVVTAPEGARLTGLAYSSLAQALREGRINAWRSGATWLFTVGALIEAAEAGHIRPYWV